MAWLWTWTYHLCTQPTLSNWCNPFWFGFCISKTRRYVRIRRVQPNSAPAPPTHACHGTDFLLEESSLVQPSKSSPKPVLPFNLGPTCRGQDQSLLRKFLGLHPLPFTPSRSLITHPPPLFFTSDSFSPIRTSLFVSPAKAWREDWMRIVRGQELCSLPAVENDGI